MQKEIIINVTADQHRIAIVEDGRLAELFIENEERGRMVGDIYLGTVVKVMPGIRASFVDIGLEQDAFLHFSDVGDNFRDFGAITGDENGVDEEREEPGENAPDRRRRRAPLLQRGQEVVVQVFKEPVGAKGVRVTTEVTLPGRFLVLMPFEGSIGVSRKITDFREKRRLRRIARSILPPGFGVIIRTVAEGQDEEVLRNDLRQLLETWRGIERTIRTSRPPTLIHKDMNASSSTIRDLFSEDVTRVAIDSPKLYRDIRAYINLVAPKKVHVLELYRDRRPIFDRFGIERQIDRLMDRKVWLKSGGYLVFDRTEAMSVIDVNSGRYAAKSDQEQNSLRTNLEAVREIALQIRLRDLGGIIVIDFIDMMEEANNRKVFEEMRREMRRDRAKYTILPISEFGLMQITRQRVRESVQLSVSETCPTCRGAGIVQSKPSLLTEIDRWLTRFRLDSREIRLRLNVHPEMARFLTAGTIPPLMGLMLRHFVRITLAPDISIPVDGFRFFSRKREIDITDQYRW
ncbi:MAG: Rne/Rng family ribonuclease [Bacteroidota bacterium]|nr:Rne/Rng family ribonuclease [Bacteroidota bacterium]